MSEAPGQWTPQTVVDLLVQAFRTAPDHAVYAPRLAMFGDSAKQGSCAAAVAFSWGGRFRADHARARHCLSCYARCRANGESWSEFCTARGWKRSTAEFWRQRGARIIADKLNEQAGTARDSNRT